MKILPTPLLTEKFEYYSDLSFNEFGFSLQKLFAEEIEYKGVNLKGTFVLQNTFAIVPKRQNVNIRNFEREISYLKGSFKSDYMNRTSVSFTVRPNSIYLIFFIALLVMGSGMLIGTINNDEHTEVYAFMFFFLLVFPAVTCVFARSVKKTIKNEFITAFNLKEKEKW
jgi:hypothetical protein